ncbi:MAG TPA: PEP-CTERM sorting domain-containing protein [Lacunisphaera sp.]|nr:PEP-CTERM sorting domain-containing protein [Lacunisphaera sp.]
MKSLVNPLRFLAAVAASLSALTAFAQTVQFFSVLKSQNSVQTDTTAVSSMPYNPAMDLYPWRFESNMNGTGLDATNPASPNRVTTPSGSTTTTFDLVAPDGTHGWQYQPGFAYQTDMDPALKNGTYSVSLANGAATSFPIALSGDLYPNSTTAILTGGAWVGNVYQINPVDPWTLNTGVYNTNFQWDSSRIEIDIWGGVVDFRKAAGAGPNAVPYIDSDLSASLALDSTEVGAPTFLAGYTYVVDIRFARIVDYQPISSQLGALADLSGAYSVGMYESSLRFSIQAIPEPSAYAAMAGVLALGLVAWRRWRTA